MTKFLYVSVYLLLILTSYELMISNVFANFQDNSNVENTNKIIKKEIQTEKEIVEIHPSLPNYIFEVSLFEYFSLESPSEISNEIVIKISRVDTYISSEVQIIEVELGYIHSREEFSNYYSLEDINFDGYKDLCILDPSSGAYNNTYTWYEFNPETGKMDGSTELCEELNSLINPVINEKSQIIEQISKATSQGEWTVSFYKVKDGKLVLIKSLETSLDSYYEDVDREFYKQGIE